MAAYWKCRKCGDLCIDQVAAMAHVEFHIKTLGDLSYGNKFEDLMERMG